MDAGPKARRPSSQYELECCRDAGAGLQPAPVGYLRRERSGNPAGLNPTPAGNSRAMPERPGLELLVVALEVADQLAALLEERARGARNLLSLLVVQ